MPFTVSEFFWNPRRYSCTVEDLKKICKVLNTLTPEQEKAVRVFGDSRREDGWDCGMNAVKGETE